MNLLFQAPNIKVAILFLLKVMEGRAPIKVKQLQPIYLEMTEEEVGSREL